jgi:phage-related protein (TIGR01555 family)
MGAIGFFREEVPEVRLDGVIENAITRLGLGKDRTEAVRVSLGGPMLSSMELSSLYIKSWLCRRVVNLYASEATRAGWDLALGEEKQKAKKQADRLVAEGEKLHLRQVMQEGCRMARLTGGAAVLMGIDDGNTALDSPVNWRRLREIRWLYPIDRWRLWPSSSWPGTGMPEAYEFSINQDADLSRFGIKGSTVTVHATRLLRIEGEPIPWEMRSSAQWWGMSVLQDLWEVFKRYETGQASAADILHDFDVVVHQMNGLRGIVDGGNEELLTKRLMVNHRARSVLGAYLIDEGEKLTNLNRSAAGISDILDRLTNEVTGATRIPHTKLWGESPSGLGATGRSEDRSLAADVAVYQEDHLQAPLRQFYGTLMRCKRGPWTQEMPEDWRIEFRPTYVLNEEEEAELRSKVATSDSQWIQHGVLKPNEVALGRFGRPGFSLDTVLMDREPDGSIRQEELDPSMIQYGGDLAPGNPNAPPGQQGGQGGQGGQDQGDAAGMPPAQAPGFPAGGQDQEEPPRRDSAEREDGCCEACEETGGSCQEEEAEPPAPPCRRKRPRTTTQQDASDDSEEDRPEVGETMHRWKHGTLHSGTGREGEHRGEVPYPTGHKQAVAIALSLAGKARPRRVKGRHRRRTVRQDALPTPGRQLIAGVLVEVREDGTGQLVGPWGGLLDLHAALGPDPVGLWEVFPSPARLDSALVLGVERRADLQGALGPEALIRPLDAIDLIARGVRIDAYDDGLA